MTTNTILRDALIPLIEFCHEAGYDCQRAVAALAAVDADQAPDEPIDYAGDFVKLAIDEAEKRGLDYVSIRILRALMAKYAARPAPFDEAKLLQLCADWECYANTDKAQAAWRELVAFARPAPVGAVQALDDIGGGNV